MDPTDFQQLRDEFYRLNELGEYAHARNLVETHAYSHPDRASTLYNWRICMAARMGDHERAVALLQEALEAGFWWPESALREDNNLAGLQGRPDFENLVMISTGRYAQAQAASKAEMLIFLPDIGAARPFPLILALHGRAGNALDTSGKWKNLASQGWIVAVPQSSQVIGKGAYCWDDIRKSALEIRDHFTMLMKDYPIDNRRVVLGGFAQGAGLAVRLSLADMIPAQGFIAVAPSINERELLPFLTGKNPPARISGYLITGDKDPDRESVQNIESLLHKLRLPHQRETHPELSHTYPDNFERSIAKAFDFFFQQKGASVDSGSVNQTRE
jgi:predicted esterase